MKVKYLDQKEFDNALNSSILEALDDEFYFLTSDGREIALTDNKFTNGNRIGIRDLKDEEDLAPSASVLIRDGKNAALLLLNPGNGGSAKSAIKVNLKSRASQQIDLTEFFGRLKLAGIDEVNIISATVMNDKIIFLNKGTHKEPVGILVVTDADFWKKQKSADIRISRVQSENLFDSPVEVSSIYYSYQNDLLIIAGSTSSIPTEGDSVSARETVLGIVENAYRKIDRKRLKVSEFFNLKDTGDVFENLDIKAMAAGDEKGKKIKIVLIGSKPEGDNSLIKLRLKAS